MADMREGKIPPLFSAERERERGAQQGDRKGSDHQICPPLRGKTPFLSEHTKTLPHLQSFMTAWDELV